MANSFSDLSELGRAVNCRRVAGGLGAVKAERGGGGQSSVTVIITGGETTLLPRFGHFQLWF